MQITFLSYSFSLTINLSKIKAQNNTRKQRSLRSRTPRECCQTCCGKTSNDSLRVSRRSFETKSATTKRENTRSCQIRWVMVSQSKTVEFIVVVRRFKMTFMSISRITVKLISESVVSFVPWEYCTETVCHLLNEFLSKAWMLCAWLLKCNIYNRIIFFLRSNTDKVNNFTYMHLFLKYIFTYYITYNMHY